MTDKYTSNYSDISWRVQDNDESFGQTHQEEMIIFLIMFIFDNYYY